MYAFLILYFKTNVLLQKIAKTEELCLSLMEEKLPLK